MTDFEKLWNFQNLHRAHTVARRNKRNTREVIEFEMNLAENLTQLSDSLRNGTYEMQGYYSFTMLFCCATMISAASLRRMFIDNFIYWIRDIVGWFS